MRNYRFSLRHVLVLTDVLSMVAGFCFAYLLLLEWKTYPPRESSALEDLGRPLWLLFSAIFCWLFLAGSSNLYTRIHLPWKSVLWRAVQVQTVVFAVLSSVLLALDRPRAEFFWISGFCAFSLPMSLGSRWLFLVLLKAHRSRTYNVQYVLVVGSTPPARELIHRLRSSEETRYEVVGCVEAEPSLAHGDVEGVPILGTTDMLPQYAYGNALDLVAFATPLDRVPEVRSLIQAVMELGLRVAVVPDCYVERLGVEGHGSEASVASIADMPMFVLCDVPRKPGYLFLKRIIDVAVSSALLIVLAPLFALIAFLLKTMSREGPIFYPWRVLGKNRKPFVGYKFRTMVPDADKLKKDLLPTNEMVGPVFKMQRDPRVTPLGQFLRTYSLDELPQLYSVLKGDMSLVGPRPAFKEEADQFEFWQRRKLSVKPGITCLWQVNGRNQIADFAEWARLDIAYIENASLWLDFKILLKTIPAVFRGHGAY